MEKTLIRRFAKNDKGRDFIIGDIHGCFAAVQDRLNAIGFDPAAGDRLFSVGDLVDRGPSSELSLAWLDQPWFFAVAGNHEDYAIRWPNGSMDAENYIANGGTWNVFNSPDASLVFSDAFAALPVAIELETDDGLIGIVHADCPMESWTDFAAALKTGWIRYSDGRLSNSRGALNDLISAAQWSRRRIELVVVGFESGDVTGVRAVVVGHTPLDAPTVIGNVIHIDTGGWSPEGHGFTIIDAATLQVVSDEKALAA